MKKRLIGTLLLGALFVSSTSMFVSCKDYDDDINNVSNRVTVLEDAKVDLEKKIAALRADLEANYATKVALASAVSDLNDAISAETNRAKQAEADEYARATAAEAALSTRIQTAQDAIDDLNTLIGGDISKSANFADCKTYKEALEKTWAKIESVETGLGNRLTALETDLNLDNPQSKIRVYLATLENQIAALQSWQAGLDADGGAATKNYVGTKIAEAEGRAAVDAATKAAEALAAAKGYTDEELAKAVAQALKDAAADAQKKADKALADAKTYADGKANEALVAAKEYAAAEAKAKADAAEAAAKAYAKEYADQMLDEAKTYALRTATAKANAAEAAAKEYADELLVKAKEYTDQEVAKAKEYAEQKATAAQTAAQNYADGKVAAAITECKGYAEQMRDAAINAAKTYTDTEITNLKNKELKDLSDRIDVIESELNILNMFVKQLRSLVFKPQGYVDGVEALKVLSLKYWKFNNHPTSQWQKDGVDWDIVEKGKTGNISWDYYNVDNVTAAATPGAANRESSHTRYPKSATEYRTLDFTAKYYINPSNANLDGITKNDVSFYADDLWFKSTRSTGIGLSVKGIVKPGEGDNAANSGELWIQYGLANPDKIQETDSITVFATQVAYKKKGEAKADTVITSDFATMLNGNIDSLVLAHRPDAASFRGKATQLSNKYRNMHCGGCATIANGLMSYNYKYTHLYATITEAAGETVDAAKNIKTDQGANLPQDSVVYDGELDLTTLAEVHYKDVRDKKHYRMADASEYGLKIKYELTYLRYGKNETSESAHAVIVWKKDGKVVEEGTEGAKPYLIPWMPTNESREGVQDVYDESKKAEKQTTTLVDRTPLVRVSLVDQAGNVLDYGYIRILITDKQTTPPSHYYRFVKYEGDGWSYNIPWLEQKGCQAYAGKPDSIQTKWIETELDLYTLAGVSHDNFRKYWKPQGGYDQMWQYVPTGYQDGKASFKRVSAAAADSLGVVSIIQNALSPETDVMKWKVSANDMKKFFVDKNPVPEGHTIAVRFIYTDGTTGNAVNPQSADASKDIYVIFSTGKITVTKAGEVTATVDWTGRKIPANWYLENSNTQYSGLDECHYNVYTPADAASLGTDVNTFGKVIAAFFNTNDKPSTIVDLSNDANQNAFLKVTDPSNTLTGKDFTLDLVFTVAGVKNEFKGILNGVEKTFVMTVENNGKTLKAYRKDDTTKAKQEVAKLSGNGINNIRVDYMKTAYAEAMLNYAAHNKLSKDVISAFVTVVANYGNCKLDVTCTPLQLRFLRPINVISKEYTVQDGDKDLQEIDLLDLVNFTDWRDIAFETNYWAYYNVTKIEVAGLSNGQKLGELAGVKTNLGADDIDAELTKELNTVSNTVDFEYVAATPTLSPTTAPAAFSYGKLIYRNFLGNTGKFTVRVPLKITYAWGTNCPIYVWADIHVLGTLSNNSRVK